MKNRKSILLVVLLLAVGFAAVSTTLYINGQTRINANQDDFNVYYSDAYVNGTQDKSVITDDTHIVFETELSTLGEKYVLDYEVTNGSKNYDAEVTMECTGDNEYLTVTNEFDDETILKATDSREGKLTLELTKSNAGEDIDTTITCTINANALERTSLGVKDRSEISVEAKDKNNTNLNAKAYEITGRDEEKLLDALVETGYVTDASEVDALIEVESDEFDNLATTIFDVSSIASEGDKVVILHFNEEINEWEYISEEVVDSNGEVTADFASYSPVAFITVKNDGNFEITGSNPYAVGSEITIANEKFNIISSTNTSVSLLAVNVIDKNYKQTDSIIQSEYGVSFAGDNGWEYTPGPKEIDIQTWSTNPKTYVNNYVKYIQDLLNDSNVVGDLITLNQLEDLDCSIFADYSYDNGVICTNSKHASWLVNEQYWWTKSAVSNYENNIWAMHPSNIEENVAGTLGKYEYSNIYIGIRPVITVSKDALKYYVGKEVELAGERFNIIGLNDNTVTMLAQYGLGSDYKQTEKPLGLTFADNNGWEYTPGPKEIDIQKYDGNVKTYVNEYVAYLKKQTGINVSGSLITLNELKKLDCVINDNYIDTGDITCANSKYNSWLANNRAWWTKSSDSTNKNNVFILRGDAGIDSFNYDYISGIVISVRPVITISKTDLEKYLQF